MHPLYSELIELSIKAKKYSYSPYSKFSVGAALLTSKNKIYTGTNVESASYSLSICAERVAFTKAVSEGEKKFTAIAISASRKDYIYPCGACRQVLSECSVSMPVLCTTPSRNDVWHDLHDLLPNAFGPDSF